MHNVLIPFNRNGDSDHKGEQAAELRAGAGVRLQSELGARRDCAALVQRFRVG